LGSPLQGGHARPASQPNRKGNFLLYIHPSRSLGCPHGVTGKERHVYTTLQRLPHPHSPPGGEGGGGRITPPPRNPPSPPVLLLDSLRSDCWHGAGDNGRPFHHPPRTLLPNPQPATLTLILCVFQVLFASTAGPLGRVGGGIGFTPPPSLYLILQDYLRYDYWHSNPHNLRG